MKITDFHSYLSTYYIIIYACSYATHLENNNEQDGLYAFIKLAFQFSLPSFLTDNPRPTDTTSVDGKYPQRAMSHLTCKKAYAS